MTFFDDEEFLTAEYKDEEFWVTIKNVKRSTDKAVLIEVEDGREMWFPKSKISSYCKEGFIIPYWLAEEKGLV